MTFKSRFIDLFNKINILLLSIEWSYWNLKFQ